MNQICSCMVPMLGIQSITITSTFQLPDIQILLAMERTASEEWVSHHYKCCSRHSWYWWRIHISISDKLNNLQDPSQPSDTMSLQILGCLSFYSFPILMPPTLWGLGKVAHFPQIIVLPVIVMRNWWASTQRFLAE